MNSDFVFICVFLSVVFFVVGPLSFKKHEYEKIREETERKKRTEEHLFNQNKEMKEK